MGWKPRPHLIRAPALGVWTKPPNIYARPESRGAQNGRARSGRMKEADTVDNNIEQSQETTQEPAVVDRAELVEVHAIASKLIEALRKVPDGDLVGEVIANSLKLLRDKTNRGDIKLIDKSFKELRYALKIFAPYRDVRKVSIFGSARTPENHPDYKQAEDFAKLMASEGWMVT